MLARHSGLEHEGSSPMLNGGSKGLQEHRKRGQNNVLVGSAGYFDNQTDIEGRKVDNIQSESIVSSPSMINGPNLGGLNKACKELDTKVTELHPLTPVEPSSLSSSRNKPITWMSRFGGKQQPLSLRALCGDAVKAMSSSTE